MKVIPANHHVLVPGRTGTGKTWAARHYLTSYKNVVALDTKGTLVWPELPGTKWDLGTKNNPKYKLIDGGKEITLVTKLSDLQHVKTPKIIYRPRLEELNFEYYEEFFKWCYFRRNTVVWVDEVMSVCPSPFKIPFYYQGILTRGRELNVAVWSLTQRPKNIPTVIISESSHFFVFDLNIPDDRARLADVTGCEEFLVKASKAVNPKDPLAKYNFWYYYVEWENAVLARLEET